MRTLLAPGFSAKRVRAQRSYIESIVDQLFTDMATRPRPVDLHDVLPLPLPVLVICNLLGIPQYDRKLFGEWSEGVTDDRDGARVAASFAAMRSYMDDLVKDKRRTPAEDVISNLAVAGEERGVGLDAIVGLATLLLVAGHATTATRIDLGTLLLLANPKQRDALIADPTLVPSAIEEILRHSSIGDGLPRYARQDFSLAGVEVKAGDAILIGGANFDERVFPSPDTFDIERHPNPHLTFSHGLHFCPGANLVKIELEVVFASLFQRFPVQAPVRPASDRRGGWLGGLVGAGFRVGWGAVRD